MKMTHIKMKQYSTIVVLVMISIALLGLIYSAGQRKVEDQQIAESEIAVEELIVEAVKDKEEIPDDLELNIEVEKIKIDSNETILEVSSEVDVEPINLEEETSVEVILGEREEMEEAIAVEPEKPNLTPPAQKPETSEDLMNADKEPEYAEEATTYIPEPETEVEEDEVRGSNLVPDSENPFFQDNIPSNGDGGAQQGSDFYQDGNPAGEGDKF